MKKLLLCLLVVLSSCGSANKIDTKYVSAATRINFNKLYPNAKDVDWEKHKNKYKAVFKTNGLETLVTLDPNGNVLQVENQIPNSSLLQKINSYFSANYGKHKIKKAFKIIDKAEEKTTFKILIKNLTLLFDENGNFLKELKEK